MGYFLARYYAAANAGDMWGQMHERDGLQVMDAMYDQTEDKFIVANHDNLLGLYLVYYRYRHLDFERLKPKFDMLSEETKDTPEGRAIAVRYKKLSEVKAGAKAPNFKLPTLTGDTVHLYGKSALIKVVDFWAS